MLFEGSPNTAQANAERATRASGTTAVGTLGTSRSATTREAPRRRASGANSAPSRLKPETATKAKPGFTRRESYATPLTSSTSGGTSAPRTRASSARSKITARSVARATHRTPQRPRNGAETRRGAYEAGVCYRKYIKWAKIAMTTHILCATLRPLILRKFHKRAPCAANNEQRGATVEER